MRKGQRVTLIATKEQLESVGISSDISRTGIIKSEFNEGLFVSYLADGDLAMYRVKKKWLKTV